MAWEDDDFEQFLKRFRLKQSRRTLPSAQMQRSGMAAIAAAILVIVGTAAAIQYFRTTESSPASDVSNQAPIVVAQTPGSQATEPIPVKAASAPEAVPPRPTTPKSTPPAAAQISGTSQAAKKLAPEPRTLSAKREIPAETVQTTAPGDDGNTAVFVGSREELRLKLRVEAEQEAGRRLVERACGACHVPTLIGNSHWDTPLEYLDFVNRKVVSGAQLTREEVPVAANYLFNSYGRPQQEPSKTDVGKATFDAACVQCHPADVMKNQAYTETRYREIVTDMISKGAIVSEAQISPLVEYLMRTYGPKRP